MTALRREDFPLGEQMSETQGPRPFDPYRTLQLHPGAPRDLIEGAYWLLVSARSPALSAARIEELNTAYAALMDVEARRSYDGGRALPATRSRGPLLRLFSARVPAAAVDPADLYQVLRIDREAEGRIIQFAYDFWMQGLHGARVDRGRIEEAHRTLSNPLRRAQYDASSGISAATPPTAPVPAFTPGAPQPAAEDETGAATVAGQPGAAQIPPSPAPRPAPRPIEEAQPAATEGPVGNGPSQTVVPPMFALAASAAPVAPAGAGPDAGPPETAPALPKQGLLRRIGLTSHGRAAPAAVAPAGGITAATAAAPAPDAASPPQAGVDPRDARLLTLRADDVAAVRVLPSRPRGAPTLAVALAELVFTAGPRIGERIAIGAETLTLGSGETADVLLVDAEGDVEPAHARIWWHSSHVVFRQLGPGDTLIGGVPLVVPLVMLEDGDDIQIGVHRLRFSLPPPA